MENKNINHFTDLDAWKINHQSVLSIYKATKKFPKEELFALINQIRRAAVSITSNIAEGFGRYRPNDKIHFYHIARGSSTETENQLIISRDLGYISSDEFERIRQLLESGRKLINGLIRSLQEINS